MICQQRGQEITAESETVLSKPLSDDDTVAASAPKAQEAEISRLTWAVIDGKASNSERLRLAQLVSAQYEQRLVDEQSRKSH